MPPVGFEPTARPLRPAKYTIMIMKSRGMIEAGHQWETREMDEKYLLEHLKWRSYVEDLGIDSSVTMKLNLNKQGGTVGTDSAGLWETQVAGRHENGQERSGSSEEFFLQGELLLTFQHGLSP